MPVMGLDALAASKLVAGVLAVDAAQARVVGGDVERLGRLAQPEQQQNEKQEKAVESTAHLVTFRGFECPAPD